MLFILLSLLITCCSSSKPHECARMKEFIYVSCIGLCLGERVSLVRVMSAACVRARAHACVYPDVHLRKDCIVACSTLRGCLCARVYACVCLCVCM